MDERPQPIAFRFDGTGGEYFRIWIVNLALTIVTLGLYSPWAKVRRLRWFYGATSLADSPFEFHGRPLAILKGRLIALVLFVAYTQVGKVSLAAWFVVVGVLVALLPWLLWRSLRFRLANTSWRGIRFRFEGPLGAAYLTFVPLIAIVIAPTLVLAILGGGLGPDAVKGHVGDYFSAAGIALLLAPWFFFRLRAYRQRFARLGTAAFAFDGRVRGAYWLAAKVAGAFLCFLFLAILVGFVAGGIAWTLTPQRSVIPAYVGGVFGYVTLIGTFFVAVAFVQNFVWNATSLDGARFESRASALSLLGIDASNLVLCIVTLGFFWPFAMVRRARYRVGVMRWTGDPDSLAGAATHAPGATGDEAADLFGLDLAL